MLGLFRVFVRHIKAHMVDGMDLHLVVDSSCNDVTRCQRQTRIVFLHKLLSVRQTKYTSVSAHRLGDEVRRMGLLGIVEAGRMELNKLHILDHTFGAMNHRNAVTGGYLGIRCRGIDCTCSTGCHQRHTTQIRVYLLRLGIEDIRTIALDIRCVVSNAHT